MAALDFKSAGGRAYIVGLVYFFRGQTDETLRWAYRCEARWLRSAAGAREKATAIRLRGDGHRINKNYPASIAAYKKSLELSRTLGPENRMWRLAEAINKIDLTGANGYRRARALERQGYRKEALPYALRAMDIYTKLRMPSHLGASPGHFKKLPGR